MSARRRACSTSPLRAAVSDFPCFLVADRAQPPALVTAAVPRISSAPPHVCTPTSPSDIKSSRDVSLLRKLHQQYQLCRWQVSLSRRFELGTLSMPPCSCNTGLVYTVTRPIQTTTITSGSPTSITWTSTVSSSALVNITLHQGGQTSVYATLATNVPNSGTFTWNVRVSLPAGGYWVRVSSTLVDPPVYGAGPTTGTFTLTAGCTYVIMTFWVVIQFFAACTVFQACDFDMFCNQNRNCASCSNCRITGTTNNDRKPYTLSGAPQTPCPDRCNSTRSLLFHVSSSRLI